MLRASTIVFIEVTGHDQTVLPRQSSHVGFRMASVYPLPNRSGRGSGKAAPTSARGGVCRATGSAKAGAGFPAASFVRIRMQISPVCRSTAPRIGKMPAATAGRPCYIPSIRPETMAQPGFHTTGTVYVVITSESTAWLWSESHQYDCSTPAQDRKLATCHV